MSLSFEQKEAVISEVSDAIASAQAGVLAEYRGLNVTQLTELRSAARTAGVWVKVVKNNLAKRVIKGSDFECLTEHFVGPVLFSLSDDAVAVAKLMSEFSKENDALKITIGSMQGEIIDQATIKQLAKLPGRDELIAKLLFTMQAPMQKLVATLNEVPSRAVRTFDAVMQTKVNAKA